MGIATVQGKAYGGLLAVFGTRSSPATSSPASGNRAMLTSANWRNSFTYPQSCFFKQGECPAIPYGPKTRSRPKKQNNCLAGFEGCS